MNENALKTSLVALSEDNSIFRASFKSDSKIAETIIVSGKNEKAEIFFIVFA